MALAARWPRWSGLLNSLGGMAAATALAIPRGAIDRVIDDAVLLIVPALAVWRGSRSEAAPP
ncbi:MAG: hypothetical protein ACRDJW_09245 [Thermomicrobiales bacterium]